MVRKKKEDIVVSVDTVAWEKAEALLNQLELQQTQEVEPVRTKLRNQVVLSLLHSASVYSISDGGVLRARIRRCIEIADIVVDELEKKHV